MASEDLSPGENDRAAPIFGTTQLLERAVVLLLFLGLLVGVLAVLRPFATAILFGMILAIAAWPLREFLLRHHLSRGLAAILLLFIALAVVALPIIAVGPELTERLVQATQRLQAYLTTAPPLPPRLAGLPIVGTRLDSFWEEARQAEGGVRTVLEPYAATVQHGLVEAAQALAQSVLQTLLSLVVAAMFWVSGDAQARVLSDILQRLGGDAAAATLQVAAGGCAAWPTGWWGPLPSRLPYWLSV